MASSISSVSPGSPAWSCTSQSQPRQGVAASNSCVDAASNRLTVTAGAVSTTLTRADAAQPSSSVPRSIGVDVIRFAFRGNQETGSPVGELLFHDRLDFDCSILL